MKFPERATSEEARSLPRYLEIETTLAAEIKAGVYPVGGLLPTERELCERFEVSRFTIRQALKGLQEGGLIARRSGVGSLVLAEAPRVAFVQSLTSMAELLRYPSETFRTDLVRQRIHASAEQAQLLLGSPGEEWIRVQGVRVARGSERPFSWHDIYVRPRFAAVFDAPNPEGEPVFRQLERHFGQRIGHAHVEIFAGQITEDLAAPMQAVVGTPALKVLRRYSAGDGEIYLVTYTVHPADRFVFTMDMERR